VNTERSNDVAGNTDRRVAANGNTVRRANAAIADVDNSETRSDNADGNTERGGCAARNTERRISAAGVHSRIVASNSERTSDVRGDGDACGRVTTDVNSRLRAKMARTELAVPPHSGRVELEPIGHW
jgi:hypothetical protein